MYIPTSIVNVLPIEINVHLPILQSVFQAPQLSTSQHSEKPVVGMKFLLQHGHGPNKTMMKMMGKRW